jgi:K+-sensing histidine kinase KdpD
MSHNPQHKDLRALQAALENLRAKTLPPDTGALVSDALAALSRLASQVDAAAAQQQEQQRLAALYRVSQTLGGSLNETEVLTAVMDAVISLTGATRGFLMLQGAQRGVLELVVGRGVDQESLDGAEMSVSRTVIKMVMGTGDGVVTTNAAEDARFSASDSVATFSLRSIVCAPLKRANDTFGVIYVDNKAKEGLFDEDDLDMLNAFAAQAAVAIENARIFTQTDERLSERVRELEDLARVNREMNRQLDVAGVAEIARTWALSATGADDVVIALAVEGRRSDLTVAGGANAGMRIPITDPRVRGAMEAGTPHIAAPDEGGLARIAVPLLVEHETAGVIAVESAAALPAEALQFLARLANLTAVSLGKARLAERLRESASERSEFISVIAHELRLPLTSIRGYADLLAKGSMGEVNEGQAEFLNVIRRNVNRMNDLITGVSDYAKVQGGRLALSLADIDLNAELAHAVEAHRANVTELGAHLNLTLKDGARAAHLDRERFTQVLGYLLDNAARYGPDDEQIEVRVEDAGLFYKVIVEDEGIGIAPGDRERVYDQFFRSEDERVRAQQGWGLGLTVSKALVELMGGEIAFESTLDEGSVFWFTVVKADKQE